MFSRRCFLKRSFFQVYTGLRIVNEILFVIIIAMDRGSIRYGRGIMVIVDETRYLTEVYEIDFSMPCRRYLTQIKLLRRGQIDILRVNFPFELFCYYLLFFFFESLCNAAPFFLVDSQNRISG